MKKNKSILSVLKGDFFSKKENRIHLPFLFLIILLLLLNIRLSFNAESLLKKSIKLEMDVSDLRLTYITTKSDLMRVYKRSSVEVLVYKDKLISSNTPPYIINAND